MTLRPGGAFFLLCKASRRTEPVKCGMRKEVEEAEIPLERIEISRASLNRKDADAVSGGGTAHQKYRERI